MSSIGLLCIILGFLLMILIIANNLLAKGILMTSDQKIQIFLDEYALMNKQDKVQFINKYYKNEQINSICQLINS